jgi:hypothetical protein
LSNPAWRVPPQRVRDDGGRWRLPSTVPLSRGSLRGNKMEGKMNESRLKYYKALFLISAIYDVFLGAVFLFFYKFAFDLLGITAYMPTFGGYLSLIGAFLFVIGIAYYLIYLGDFQRNRDLIKVGVLYKLAYCATTFYYFAIGQIPHMIFVSFFGVIDLIMFILMLECLVFVGKMNRKVVANP